MLSLTSDKCLQWIISVLLVGTAMLSYHMKQKHLTQLTEAPIQLNSVIPTHLTHWQQYASNDELSPKAAGTYSQALERSYQNKNGEIIMLSIAYGDKQIGDKLQAHRPEYCYQAQGFIIQKSTNDTINTEWGALPIRKLLAQRNERHEFVSYWLTIGHQAVLPGFSRKMAQLKASLSGAIPDGMVIRISTVNTTEEQANALEYSFITDLLRSITPSMRSRFIGINELIQN